jgi:hypothetical protein
MESGRVEGPSARGRGDAMRYQDENDETRQTQDEKTIMLDARAADAKTLTCPSLLHYTDASCNHDT